MDMSRRVFEEIKDLATERLLPGSEELDTFDIAQILEFISSEDAKVAPAVRRVLPAIEKAVERVLESFKSGGRLIYVGAGTSGRLGILDAAECPPTFGSDPARVIGIIAGGKDAVFLSREGAEDDEAMGEKDLMNLNLQTADTVIGIAASRRTPYVLSALRFARSAGANTIFIMCNPPPEGEISPGIADVLIAPDLGPEVIMGSTRMKAGTATKMILNMITTTAFIRSGHVYKGMMVDLKAWSQKLKARSIKILMLLTNMDYQSAEELLRVADGKVKTAILMGLLGIESGEAEDLLARSGGFVRKALEMRKI